MKIMQIISQLGNGGAEKLVMELSNELEKQNQVVLVSFREIREWMYFPKKLKTSIKLIELNKKEGFDVTTILKLMNVIRKEQPDVINIHLESTLKYTMMIMPFFRKTKFVYTIHSNLEYSEKYFRKFSKVWFFKNIQFICLSEEISDKFRESFPSLNFETINNGIANLEMTEKVLLVKEEIEKYKSDKNTFIMLYVGRLSYEKNIPLLLDVYSKIDEKNVKLLIIGKDSSEEQNNFKLVKNYKRNNLIYLGAKENVQDHMKYANALLLTSRYEGLPLVVLEALSLGLPIISTPVGSLVKIIENTKNGFVSDEISTTSVVKAIEALLALTDQEREEIKSNNRELFEQKYSIEHCANSYDICYQNI